MDKKVEQLFYAVLGGALAVKEKIETGHEELNAWQEKSEQNARAFFDEMAQRGEKEKEQLKIMCKDILKEVIAELDLVTRQDLERLHKDPER